MEEPFSLSGQTEASIFQPICPHVPLFRNSFVRKSTEDITKAIALVERLMNVIEDVLCEGFDKEVYKA